MATRVDGRRVYIHCAKVAVADHSPAITKPCPEGCPIELWSCCACTRRAKAGRGSVRIGAKCLTEGCTHKRCEQCPAWNECGCGCGEGESGKRRGRKSILRKDECKEYVFHPQRMCRPCAKGMCSAKKDEGLDRVLRAVEGRIKRESSSQGLVVFSTDDDAYAIRGAGSPS